MKQSTTKKGFTIIEVVLVLAIAGLIFMMVFIALPALQRSQRDTQRSADISRVSTALNQYQGSNRGRIPATKGGSEYIAGHKAGSSATNAGDVGTWKYFYDNYLIVKAGGAQDSFTDPDGGDYSLWITECKPAQDEVGNKCSNGQRFGVTFDSQANAKLPNEDSITPSNDKDSGDKKMGHSISIVTNATCDGEFATYSTGARKVAILYKKEGGGVFCVNN